MLNNQELEQYKKELENKKRRLVAGIEKESEPQSFGGDVVESGEEEADEAEELSNTLAVAQTLRDEVAEIDTALERIRDGKYGTCANCGKEIQKEVLAAAPESILCENCKIKA